MKEKNEIGYKVVKEIPFSTIAVGSFVRKKDDVFFINGANVPFFTDAIVKVYCTEVEIHKRELELNTNVLFHKTLGDDKLEHGVIIDFNEYTGLYQIQYKTKGSYKRTYTKWLKPEEIIIPKEYYFLSSKGVVQSDFTYRDEEVDKWRKAVGNFFEDKKDCQAYRQKIIDSFKE